MRMEWQWENKRWENPGRTRGGRGKIMGRGKEIKANTGITRGLKREKS